MATKNPKTKATLGNPNADALKISSRPVQFRRAGRLFTREAVIVPVAELSDEQIELLMEEPMLSVIEVNLADEELKAAQKDPAAQ